MFDGGEPAAGAAAAAAGAGAQTVQLGAESMAALHAAAGRPAAGGAAREPSEKITLGKAPQVAHERRPEWFSPKDVAPFERHEEAFKRLSLLEGQAFKEAWVELDPEARRLASVPVYAQDLARCPRLLALDLVYSRLTEEADNILIKGTSLAGDRESEEQRSEDRERRADLAKLQKGTSSKPGLRSAWFILGWRASGSSQWFRTSLGQWHRRSMAFGTTHGGRGRWWLSFL